VRSAGLSALVDDGAFLAHESQLHLVDVHGLESWTFDLEIDSFTFGARGTPAATTYGVELLGSAAPGPRSWLWGWANPAGFRSEVLRAATAARTLGEQRGVPELAAPEVPFREDGQDEDPPGMRLAYELSVAARVAAGRWFAYSGDVGGGTRAWLLLEGPRLPEPDLVRTVRVIGETVQAGVLDDHRRALASYAALRGLEWDGTALHLPQGRLAVELDAHGRISALSGTA
jgi:hypothetical protein